MSSPTISHGKFAVERVYDAPTARVFAAWADPAIKAKWFIGPEGWTPIKRELDFRTGGHELLQGRFATKETSFLARFHSIVADARIVFTYDMHESERHHSVSLTTVELFPAGAGTRLVLTEQVAFLDGTDGGEGTLSREFGTAAHLERLTHHI